MNKATKSVRGVFILMVLLSSFIGIVSAENLTINKTIITNETVKEEAVCEEQLGIILEEYNSLLKDYKDGSNCGMASTMIKGMNEVLAEERDSCREEIGETKVYRGGFFVLLGVLFITAIILLFSGMRRGK